MARAAAGDHRAAFARYQQQMSGFVQQNLGAGLGPAFNSSLRHLAAVIPAAERGQVMSAYYLTGYLSLAIPAVLAGLAATRSA